MDQHVATRRGLYALSRRNRTGDRARQRRDHHAVRSESHRILPRHGGLRRKTDSATKRNSTAPASSGTVWPYLPVNRNWIFTQTHNSGDKHAYDLTYYDGLGYAEQEVGIRAVANGTADLVRPIVYDLHHRETHKYLPFARTNGNGEYDPAAIVHQEEFYRNKFDLGSVTPYAYVLEEYEPSPVGRVLESRKPGSEFQTTERSVRNNYFANDASAVLRLDVDAVSQNLKVNGFYAENMLSGVKTVDEDGAVSIVYTDKEGHTVYEERQLRGEGDVVDRIVTRYVYDDCGRLAWVVTPEGVDRLTQGASYAATSDLARNYCYFYRYDEYGRQIERQMPAANRNIWSTIGVTGS